MPARQAMIALMKSPQYAETIEAVDAIRELCEANELTPDQFASQITDVFYDYLIDEDPRDDVSGLVDYCVSVASEVCQLSLFADRVLPERLYNQLRWILDQQGDGVNLTHTVRVLRSGLEQDDGAAKIELVELCQHGYETHQAMFSAVDSEREVISLAYEFRVVTALAAAVRPTSPGRLASEDKSRGLALPRTLDLLAHLANDPVDPTGRSAREALIELCSYPETAGLAAVRLPVHLLTTDQRQFLHEVYVDHEDRLGPQEVRIFITDEQLRDREILRSVLWQSNDVARMVSASDHTSAS